MKIFKFFFLFLLLTGLISCGEKEGGNCCTCEFTPTTEGANTISFKINGEPWSICSNDPGNSLGGASTKPIGFYWDNVDGYNMMSIDGFRFIDENEDQVQIILDPPTEELLTQYRQRWFRLFLGEKSKHNPGVAREYSLDSTHPYQINVNKFDEVNRIVSGTCYGTVKNVRGNPPKDSTSLEITDGQFDIKF